LIFIKLFLFSIESIYFSFFGFFNNRSSYLKFFSFSLFSFIFNFIISFIFLFLLFFDFMFSHTIFLLSQFIRHFNCLNL